MSPDNWVMEGYRLTRNLKNHRLNINRGSIGREKPAVVSGNKIKISSSVS